MLAISSQKVGSIQNNTLIIQWKSINNYGNRCSTQNIDSNTKNTMNIIIGNIMLHSTKREGKKWIIERKKDIKKLSKERKKERKKELK